jgi:hypothetical protein
VNLPGSGGKVGRPLGGGSMGAGISSLFGATKGAGSEGVVTGGSFGIVFSGDGSVSTAFLARDWVLLNMPVF